MVRFISIPKLNNANRFTQVNIDHIIHFDGEWINVPGGRIPQVITSAELIEKIRVADVNGQAAVGIPTVPVVS